MAACLECDNETGSDRKICPVCIDDIRNDRPTAGEHKAYESAKTLGTDTRFTLLDHKLARKQQELEDAKAKGTLLSFCDNPMQSNGYVYTCRINEAGEAVCVKGQSFWGVNYAPAPEIEGQNLGKVVVEWRPNVGHRMRAGHRWEGNG